MGSVPPYTKVLRNKMEHLNNNHELPTHDIYLTPESISIAALIDQLYQRLDHPKKEVEKEEV